MGAKGATTNVDAQQSAFLAAYETVGNITEAAKNANVSRSLHYRWLEDSPGYQERFQQASQAFCDYLEGEARRRAVEGVEEPVFFKGEVCGYRKRYSDVLMVKLLSANIPERYGDRMSWRQLQVGTPNLLPLSLVKECIHLVEGEVVDVKALPVNGKARDDS